jgi:hypothetical protein
MSNHAKIGSLSARIGEVSRAIEKLQSELTDLGHQLQRAISEDRPFDRATHVAPRGPQPLVRRAGVIVPPPGATTDTHFPIARRIARGRAGTIPAQVAKVLAETPDRQYKPRELAEKLNLNGTQARSLGITLLRLRKEGRVGFNPQTKTYHRPQA